MRRIFLSGLCLPNIRSKGQTYDSEEYYDKNMRDIRKRKLADIYMLYQKSFRRTMPWILTIL